MGWKSTIFRWAFEPRLRAIDRFRRHPLEAQQRALAERLKEGVKTSFGRERGLLSTWSAEEFARRVEVFDYERFKPYLERMMRGERDVTASGRVVNYAQSSGTTSDRSKYIPVTRRSVLGNHSLGMRDVMALYLAAHPHSTLLDGRVLTLGGSFRREQGNRVGDLSAVIFKNTSPWNQLTCTPSARETLLPDFESKCEAIARVCAKQDVRAFAGVPSWNLELMHHLLRYTGKRNLKEVWPRLELFMHGGVSFTPYREAFRELIPSSEMAYVETYNASEGFFAMADDPTREDMLLMLDYGTYYEFRQGETICPLEGVKVGETYAMLITANNGLWRYEIGDTVTFTSTDPYRIRFAGRTRQFLNAFGEELIVENAERALVEVCRRMGARVEEYTVAPRFMTNRERGCHEWVVEFSRTPEAVEPFAEALDEALRRINSDYDAKRRTTLDRLVLHAVPAGRFLRWMRSRGKNKVPRMMHERRVLEEILQQE